MKTKHVNTGTPVRKPKNVRRLLTLPVELDASLEREAIGASYSSVQELIIAILSERDSLRRAQLR